MNYNFCLNDFEGPLDLLLHLVRQSKLDIYEINLRDLIDQYLAFISEMENLNIDIASEYLVMASELVHLKSRLLINKKEEDEEENEDFEINSEEDLRRKIIEYESIKNITDNFRILEERRGEVHTKLPESLKEYYETQKLEPGLLTSNDLYNAMIEFQKKLKLMKPLNTKITKKEISVEDRSNDIKNILKIRKKVDFFSLFDTPTKEYVVVTFLAVLQLSKDNEIKITQDNNFSPIVVEEV